MVISNFEEKMKFSQKMRSEIRSRYSESPNRQDIYQAMDTLKPIEECSVLVLVCYKNDTITIHDDGIEWNMSAKDIEALELMSIGASVENMLLRAQSLGVASLWCGDILYAYNFLKSYSNYPIVSAICFGYGAYVPEKTVRKEFNETVRFIN